MLQVNEAWAWDCEAAIGGAIVDYPTMVSASNGTDTYIAVGEENMRSLLLFLKTKGESGATLITHNGLAYDIPLIRNFGIEMPWGVDTLQLSYLLDETDSRGLENQCMMHLNTGSWKGMDWRDFDPNSVIAAEYAARDALYTWRLYGALREKLGARMVVSERVLTPAWIALDRASRRGLAINLSAVARERAKAEAARDSSKAKLLAMVGEKFNPGSSRQVAAYLESHGVIFGYSEKGNPIVNEAALNEINNDFTRELLEYRGAIKTITTYCDNYERVAAEGDGRVHPKYSITRTLTGRSAASALNTQNLPRDKKDFLDFSFSTDWSAIEFRVAAWVAQEPVVLENYKRDRNWDPHRYFAALFYNKAEADVTKAERQVAKSANFGLLFLGTAITLVEYAKKMGLELGLQFCNALYRKWHEAFPGFRRLYFDTKKEIIETSECRNAAGGIRHFGDLSIMTEKNKMEALRQAVNMKVQGLAAYIAFMTMAELDRCGFPLNGFYHDAFSFDYPPEKDISEVVKSVESIMRFYPSLALKKYFNVDFDMPLEVETTVNHA